MCKNSVCYMPFTSETIRSSADAEIARYASRWTHELLPPKCKTSHFPSPTKSLSVEFGITRFALKQRFVYVFVRLSVCPCPVCPSHLTANTAAASLQRRYNGLTPLLRGIGRVSYIRIYLCYFCFR